MIIAFGVCILIGLVLFVRQILRVQSAEDLRSRIAAYFETGMFLTSLYKVDAGSRNYGGELVAQTLKDHNVEFIFTLVGTSISSILVACDKIGIRIVDTRHEATAMFAADAASRLRPSSIGVCVVTSGPGVTNTVTAAKNAQVAEVPVLLIGGTVPSRLKGRGALLDIDQKIIFKSICKSCTTVNNVRDIIPTLRSAIQLAKSGTPGPVFVEFTSDVLGSYELAYQELGIIDEPKSLFDNFLNLYLENYICNLFGSAWNPQSTTPLPTSVPYPNKTQVHDLVNLIDQSKQPLMLIGGQILFTPVRPEDIRTAIQNIQIPCYLFDMGRGLLGRDHALQVKFQLETALNEADLIIVAGCPIDYRLDYGKMFSCSAKVVIISRNKKELTRNSDLYWKPALSIHANVASTILQSSMYLQSKGYVSPIGWINHLNVREFENHVQLWSQSLLPTDNHLNPLKLLFTIEDNLSDDAIIIADGGSIISNGVELILRPRGPGLWLQSGPGIFGTLGTGAGFALAAKLCYPDKQVVIIYGDGAFGFSLSEIDTFERHNTPILSIIANDACWKMIAVPQKAKFGSDVGCVLKYRDYEKATEGLGGRGYKLDQSNAFSKDQLTNQIKAAITGLKNGKPITLNVLIGNIVPKEERSTA